VWDVLGEMTGSLAKLQCLQRQTFGNFEAGISVDGNDAENVMPPVTDKLLQILLQEPVEITDSR
jgi:hypothetical protein